MAAMFLAATSTNTGCVKSSNNNTTIPSVNLPDISNFTISAVNAFVKGASTLVSVASSSLADGAYTIYFDLTGANNVLNASASLNISGDKGTFSTPVLSNDGLTSIVIKKIVSSTGESSSFTSTISKSFSDSSGLMTCNINGTAFRATHVNATWLGSGSILSISGVYWDPLTTVTLYWDSYTGTTATRYFNDKVNVPGAWNSVYNGSASYGAPGISQLSANGSITVTSKTGNAISGTFTFTCDDSTRLTTGTFNCKID